MAIAKMNKISIVSEEKNQLTILETLQETGTLHPIDLKTVDGYLSDILKSDDYSDRQEELILLIDRIQQAISIIDEFLEKEPLTKRLIQKRYRVTRYEINDLMGQINVEEICLKYEQLKKQLLQLDYDLEQAKEKENFIYKWRTIPINPKDVENFRYFEMVLFEVKTEKLDQVQATLETLTDDIYWDIIYSERDETGLVMIYDRSFHEKICQWLQQQSVRLIEYPYSKHPVDELKDNLLFQEKAATQCAEIIAQLSLGLKDRELLIFADAFYKNQWHCLKVAEMTQNGGHLFVLEGWLPENMVEQVIKKLDNAVGDNHYAYMIQPPEASQIDDVPTKFENNKLNTPFEELTKQYGIPKYNSIDPTPYFSVFNILYFGMMSADVGYGLLLFLTSKFALKFMDNSQKRHDQLLMFNYLSVGTILVGLFYGSFFGFDLPFRVLNISNQVIESLVLSIAIGMVHLTIGYCLHVYLATKNKTYASIYLNGLQWIMILLGSAVLAVNGLVHINSILLQHIGLFLILGNIAGMFIVNLIAANNPLIGIGKGLFGLINVSSLVGDVISYTRLAALGISGANIAMAFNLILSLLPPLFRFTIGILLFIVLHGINIFIGYLGAYVHAMRLEYVEFFGKFFQPGGQRFNPLCWDDEHVVLKTNGYEEK